MEEQKGVEGEKGRDMEKNRTEEEKQSKYRVFANGNGTNRWRKEQGGEERAEK